MGSALVADLVRDGQRVIVLTRDALQARASFGPGVWVSTLLLAGQNVVPIAAVAQGCGFARPHLDGALDNLAQHSTRNLQIHTLTRCE